MDQKVGHWIKGLSYLFVEGKDIKDSYRYYFVHENTIVYDLSSGKQGEAYKIQGLKCLIPLCSDPLVNNYFRVFDYNYSRKYNYIAVEGKPSNDTINVLNMWNLMEVKYPLDVITIGRYVIKGSVYKTNKSSPIIRNRDVLIISIFNYLPKILASKATSFSKGTANTREYKDFVTELPEDFPRKEYKASAPISSKTIHWGQRKLLLSEIEFLTQIYEEKKDTPILVIYAGAASGIHIPLLSAMFPWVKFVLYDPAHFDIFPTDNIMILQSLLLEKDLEKYSKDNFYIISDIRSIPKKGKKYKEEFEEHVAMNNTLQAIWAKDPRTSKSLLKFRVPFVPGETRYMCGRVMFQAWPPLHSTETRLSVSRVSASTECVYDHKKYEEQLFYFNTVYRPSSFYDIHYLYGKNYDTIREYQILRDYLLGTNVAIMREVDMIILNLSYIIDNYLSPLRKKKKHVVDFLFS